MNQKRDKGFTSIPSPWQLFLLVIGIVFLAEAAVMLLFSLVGLLPEEHGVATALTDAVALSLLSAPLLWWFAFRPLRRAALAEHIRAAALVGHSTDGIITINEHGLVESVNPAAERLFGYTTEELLYKPVTLLMPERYRDAHQRAIERFRLTSEARFIGKTLEFEGLRRDGSEFPLELSLASWRVGARRYFSSVIRDISERKQAESQKADFTAMIAHDLRSPLTAVLSGASMIEDSLLGPVNDEQKKWLGKIGANVRNLVELVNDFLDLSKLEAGRIDLAKEEVGLNQLIQSSIENYLPLSQDKRITLRNKADPSLPKIVADPRRFEQVLTNLISNALKFTAEGGEIEVGVSQESAAEVKIWVRDNGVGISPQEIGTLFEKYRQTTSGKNSNQKGTGLGLVICKIIVEAHGGSIQVESQPGKGSTFTVTIPCNQ